MEEGEKLSKRVLELEGHVKRLRGSVSVAIAVDVPGWGEGGSVGALWIAFCRGDGGESM
jgi:hypothetical protein